MNSYCQHPQIFLLILRYLYWTKEDSVERSPITTPTTQFDPQWVELLRLRFEFGFNDKAIAQKMQLSDRTIRNYWSRIQDALKITDDPEKNTKVLIGIEARKLGLID